VDVKEGLHLGSATWYGSTITMMIDPRHILFGDPPLQKGTIQLFAGLTILLAGIVTLLLTRENYGWAVVVLGAAVGCSGGFKVSRPEGKNI
jgi:hypothetical protein